MKLKKILSYLKYEPLGEGSLIFEIYIIIGVFSTFFGLAAYEQGNEDAATIGAIIVCLMILLGGFTDIVKKERRAKWLEKRLRTGDYRK